MAGSPLVGLTSGLFFLVLLWGYQEAKQKPIFWVILFAYGMRVLAAIFNLYVVAFPGQGEKAGVAEGLRGL